MFRDNHWGPEVDVYATGMCVIHLLSGCQPYGELENEAAVLELIHDGRIATMTIDKMMPKCFKQAAYYKEWAIRCIKEVDTDLYNCLVKCLAPIVLIE